ncbi:MAG: branched-chain amino acid ABC transporter permease [Acidimicrobiales bacterium]
MNALTEAIGFGIVTAMTLAISTVAVSLQHSVTSVPNFAHGDIMSAGAYSAYTVSLFNHSLLLQALAAVVVGALVAGVLNSALLQPFIRRGAKAVTLLVITVAVALIIQSITTGVYTGSTVNYALPSSSPHKVGPFLLSLRDGIIIAVALVVLASVHVILRYTKFGKAQRAVSDNPELARASGIDSSRVVQLTWLWAGAMTGLGGFVLAGQLGSFTPTVGFYFLFVVYSAAVVGGLGNVYGAIVGALLIGVGTSVSGLYVSGDFSQSFAFVVLIATLLLRPSGLFASRVRVVAEL